MYACLHTGSYHPATSVLNTSLLGTVYYQLIAVSFVSKELQDRSAMVLTLAYP